MTNPDNAVGTNAAFNGRTSPNAFNDVLAGFLGFGPTASRLGGVLRGWPARGISADQATIGSTGRDVAIACNPSGDAVTINNISKQPITIDMPSKPTSGSRLDGIVAYVTNPPMGTSGSVDNPEACGIIGVAGTGASTLTEETIRQAITADGGDGATAYYALLDTVTRRSTEATIGHFNSTDPLNLELYRMKFPLTHDDINKSSFTPYWDTIAIKGTGNIEQTSLNLTSTMGNRYTVEVINGGDSIQLASYPDVRQIETFSNAFYDVGMPGNLRARRLAQNVNVISKQIYNINNGTMGIQGILRNPPLSAEGVYVADIGSLSGNCISTTIHTVCKCIKDSYTWSCFVEANCSGADSAWSGMVECQIGSAQYAPAFYKAQTESHVTSYNHVIKILRTS